MKKLIIIWAVLIGILCLTYCCQAQTWKANPKYIKTATRDTVKHDQKKFQCYGTTFKGLQCKRKVSVMGEFCYQHAAQK